MPCDQTRCDTLVYKGALRVQYSVQQYKEQYKERGEESRGGKGGGENGGQNGGWNTIRNGGQERGTGTGGREAPAARVSLKPCSQPMWTVFIFFLHYPNSHPRPTPHSPPTSERRARACFSSPPPPSLALLPPSSLAPFSRPLLASVPPLLSSQHVQQRLDATLANMELLSTPRHQLDAQLPSLQDEGKESVIAQEKAAVSGHLVQVRG